MTSRAEANVLGASIFWLYIIAALSFTGLIIRDLIAAYTTSYDGRTVKKFGVQRVVPGRQKAEQFFVLSCLSFGVLSYQMLSFLLDSYGRWIIGHSSRARLLIHGGLSDRIQITGLPYHLWTWSISSTLFHDFAAALCSTPQRFWWTQQALLYSFAWSIFMAVQGVRFQIQNLWAYFILAQILPNSFTQNLFYVALFLNPRAARDRDLMPASWARQATVVTVFLASVCLAPSVANTTWSLLSLLWIRVCLFAPYLTLKPSSRSSKSLAMGAIPKDYFGCKTILIGLGLSMYAVSSWRAGSLQGVINALNEDHAVAALGVDYLIGILSTLLYLRSGG